MRTGLLGVALVLCGVAAAAQITARQVVEHSLQARGGAAQFAAVRSLSFTGVLQFGAGQSAPLSVWLTTQPARIRIEVQLPRGKMIEAYDGKQAWQLSPGQQSPAVLQGAAARQVRDQALAGVDLIANAEAKVRLLGQGLLQGHHYYKIGFALATGDIFVQYIDATTWLAFHETYPGGVEDIAGYQRFGGLLLPTRYVSGPAGQAPTTLVRQHTELDLPIPEALFRLPAVAASRPAAPPGRSPAYQTRQAFGPAVMGWSGPQ